MNTILLHPFSRVKQAMALASLNWRIWCVESDMKFWRRCLCDPQYFGHTNYIDGKLWGCINQHSKLCARREALRGRA